MEWADDAATVIDEITATAQSAPSRDWLKLVGLAIGRLVKVILHADDSAGAIGNLARQLLETHEEICDAGVDDPKALAKWMVRFGFDDQNFFIVDPVRYSTASGDDGLALLRRAVDDRSATPDPDFAVRYTQERLAGLDGESTAVELLGGGLTGTYQFIRVAEAMVELGSVDDALAWARPGIKSKRLAGRQVLRHRSRCDRRPWRRLAVFDLRREQHQRMPNSTSYALLKTAAASINAWPTEQEQARAVLAARDVGGLVDALLADGAIDAAWDRGDRRRHDRSRRQR